MSVQFLNLQKLQRNYDKMKRILLLVSMLCVLTLLNSCIKDEPLNAECDITGVDPAWLNEVYQAAEPGSSTGPVYIKDILIGTPIVTNNYVSFNIKKGMDRSSLAPRFLTTAGAVITAQINGQEVEANGKVRDFSSPQLYTLHSEDGAWSKHYIVSFNYPQALSRLNFEHFELDASKRYQVWYEVDPSDKLNPRRDYWASGNGGYALTGMGKTVESYPTLSDPLGVNGNCVKLITRSTGSFGSMVKMPIAAGNIFIGTFDTRIAMMQPRQATGFGLQLVGGKPVRLEGYYKYRAGEVVTDEFNNPRPELKDTADIYAVLYEVDPSNFVPLNGDDVLSSERIVMMARIDNPGEPAEWTHFSEPFKYMNNKSFSEERLRKDGYAVAIVATSSRQGAYFIGAVGSILHVDEMHIVWEGEEEENL